MIKGCGARRSYLMDVSKLVFFENYNGNPLFASHDQQDVADPVVDHGGKTKKVLGWRGGVFLIREKTFSFNFQQKHQILEPQRFLFQHFPLCSSVLLSMISNWLPRPC